MADAEGWLGLTTARATLWTWIVIASLYFLWENTVAQGVANWLLERQYGELGAFRPTSTLFGLFLLVGLPAIALFFLYWRRQHRRTRQEPADPVGFASVHRRLLLMVAGVAGAGAIISLLLMLGLPTTDGPIRPIAASGPPGAELPDGATRLTGPRPVGPKVRYVVRLPWGERVTYYVPVPGDAGTGTRLFVQLDSDGAVPAEIAGLTARNALPPSVRNLFANLGIRAPGPHYVLFTQPAELRRPYLLAAAQCALAGLIVLFFAALQHRNVKRARARADEIGRREVAPSSVQPAGPVTAAG